MVLKGKNIVAGKKTVASHPCRYQLGALEFNQILGLERCKL
jgi:hypothetical protein